MQRAPGRLEKVVISSFQESSGGSKDQPQESLTLNFTKIEYKY